MTLLVVISPLVLDPPKTLLARPLFKVTFVVTALASLHPPKILLISLVELFKITFVVVELAALPQP